MALKARAALVFPCFILSLVSGAMVKRSDDVGIQALQTLVQQQASAISALEAKLASLSNVNADVVNLKNKVATLSTAGTEQQVQQQLQQQVLKLKTPSTELTTTLTGSVRFHFHRLTVVYLSFLLLRKGGLLRKFAYVLFVILN